MQSVKTQWDEAYAKELDLKPTPIDGLNKKHRAVAMMYAYGLTPPEIARSLNVSENTVKRYVKMEETVPAAEFLHAAARELTAIKKEKFDKLLMKSLNHMEDVLDATEGVTPEHKTRIALAVLDRHPDGEFTKSTKLKYEAAGLTNEAIEKIKRHAHQTDAEVIDILPTGSLPVDTPAQSGEATVPTTPPRTAPVNVPRETLEEGEDV